MRVIMVGYSGDFRNGRTASTHLSCSIRKRMGDLLLHDCDATRGSSGGPMFILRDNRPYLTAIHVAEYRDGFDFSLSVEAYERAHANIAIPISTFLSMLKKMIAE